MTYYEIVKKENKDGFLYVLLPMILLAVAGIWFDMPIFAVIAVIVFVWGIFKIVIPSNNKIRWAFLDDTDQKELLTLQWAYGSNINQMQELFPDRDVAEEFATLDSRFKRWVAEQQWKIKYSK